MWYSHFALLRVGFFPKGSGDCEQSVPWTHSDTVTTVTINALWNIWTGSKPEQLNLFRDILKMSVHSVSLPTGYNSVLYVDKCISLNYHKFVQQHQPLTSRHTLRNTNSSPKAAHSSTLQTSAKINLSWPKSPWSLLKQHTEYENTL